MEIPVTRFRQLWADFVASFKGSLINDSKNSPLAFSIAKLALSESITTWLSEYTVNGRWLSKLIAENPEQGRLVKDIFTKDMSLTEVPAPETPSRSLNYLIPGAVAAAGYGLAACLKLGTIATACSTIIPAVISFPAINTYVAAKKRKNEQVLIEAYVSQLDKYYESILSILSAPLD